MSFTRKIKRTNGLPNIARCCKTNMWNKPGYDTETHHFFVCPKCGKEKWVRKEQQYGKRSAEKST